MRPDNFLVHGSWPEGLDLLLCDFGGARCEAADILGSQIPDAGFFNPKEDWTSDSWTTTEATDIFALGSVLYTIITGHWPFRAGGGLFDSGEEHDQYEAHVEGLFTQGIFPDTHDLIGGEIIHGCWSGGYSTVEDISTSSTLNSMKEAQRSSAKT